MPVSSMHRINTQPCCRMIESGLFDPAPGDYTVLRPEPMDVFLPRGLE